MPLIDELPPRVRPWGQNTLRRPARGCGMVATSQAYGPRQSMGVPAGIWISGASSGGPASSSMTRVAGSSLSRAASTHPALPAPAMT
jgi:hypothetical protein